MDDKSEKEDTLINDNTTQDIDVSISQLKNILNKNK